MTLFSKRQGFVRPKNIVVRDGLPKELRNPIIQILSDYLPSRFLKDRVEALFNPYGIATLPGNEQDIPREGDADPHIGAFKQVLLNCEWFEVYDVVEDAYANLVFHEEELADADEEPRAGPLQNAINEYFLYAGIGWQMVGGKIITRQEPDIENAIRAAISQLKEEGRPTAAKNIDSAIRALSERPSPNTSGAVSHATNSVECVLSDITGETLTLGKYLDRYPKIFHPALKKTLDGIYGFASDAGARHGKEGVEPSVHEAQFAVTTCVAACTLLNASHPKERS